MITNNFRGMNMTATNGLSLVSTEMMQDLVYQKIDGNGRPLFWLMRNDAADTNRDFQLAQLATVDTDCRAGVVIGENRQRGRSHSSGIPRGTTAVLQCCRPCSAGGDATRPVDGVRTHPHRALAVPRCARSQCEQFGFNGAGNLRERLGQPRRKERSVCYSPDLVELVEWADKILSE
jgi:hypothetical protein